MAGTRNVRLHLTRWFSAALLTLLCAAAACSRNEGPIILATTSSVGQALRIASSSGAYTLTDRGTFEALKSAINGDRRFDAVRPSEVALRIKGGTLCHPAANEPSQSSTYPVLVSPIGAPESFRENRSAR